MPDEQAQPVHSLARDLSAIRLRLLLVKHNLENITVITPDKKKVDPSYPQPS